LLPALLLARPAGFLLLLAGFLSAALLLARHASSDLDIGAAVVVRMIPIGAPRMIITRAARSGSGHLCSPCCPRAAVVHAAAPVRSVRK
jgi:hypothetical protein